MKGKEESAELSRRVRQKTPIGHEAGSHQPGKPPRKVLHLIIYSPLPYISDGSTSRLVTAVLASESPCPS